MSNNKPCHSEFVSGSLLGALCLVLIPAITVSLPSFQRMFEGKNGYKVNCTLCHTPDRKRLNDYGNDFLKEGYSLDALETIGNWDADKDLARSFDEVKARSNPGNDKSTPTSPGFWLNQIFQIPIPIVELETAFPDATTFELLERKLTKDEASVINKKIEKGGLSESQYNCVIFVAKSDEGIKGGAMYMYFPSMSRKRGLDFFLLSANPNGRIVKLSPINVRYNKKLKRYKFLRQFKGLWPENIETIKFPTKKAEVIRAFRRQVIKYSSIIDLAI
ncbi:hypothetical protein ACFL6Y_03510 [Elusimicrobiota bacterium]